MLRKTIVLSFFLCFFLIGPVAFAEKGSGADFGVQPIYPNNQQNGELGYFNLSVEPGTKQEISVQITNYSEQENVINIRPTRATTSDGGVISYKEFDKEKDSSIVHDFNDIVKVSENRITIPAMESVEVIVEVELPEERFTGEILGGLHFFKEQELTDEDQEKTVINTFSYSIPIVLKESDEKVLNDLEIIKTRATQRNYHNYVETTIQNKEASIINKMTIEGAIQKKGSSNTLYTRKEENYKMAPNSTLNFGFDLNDTPLKAGKYTVTMTVDADGETFVLEDEFEISKEEAKKMNEESVYLEKSNLSMIQIVSFLLIIIVVLLILLLVKYRKNNKSA